MLLVGVISLAILFLPGYVLFYNLSEIDLLRSVLNWENPDDIDQCATFDKKLIIAQIGGDSIRFVPENRNFESIAPFSSQYHLLTEKVSVLRC